MQVAGQGDAAFLICSVDDTVEGLGRLLSGWEHADVVNDDEVGATDAGDHSLDGGVDRGPADSCSERLQREPGHAHALLDDGGSERLAEVGLAVGPQMAKFSARPTHSRVISACWVGVGMEESSRRQLSKVLPEGKPAARRRMRRVARSRPAISSRKSTRRTSAGSQRWARAVAQISGAARRM